MTLSGDDLSRYEGFERGVLDRLPLEARHVARSKTRFYDAVLLIADEDITSIEDARRALEELDQ